MAPKFQSRNARLRMRYAEFHSDFESYRDCISLRLHRRVRLTVRGFTLIRFPRERSRNLGTIILLQLVGVALNTNTLIPLPRLPINQSPVMCSFVRVEDPPHLKALSRVL